MGTLDVRAGDLSIIGYPGNEHTIELTWPSGALTGTTWAATLDGTAITAPVVAGDVLTVALTIPALSAGSVPLVLTETSGTPDAVRIVGRVRASERGSAAQSTTSVTVTSGTATATVTVVPGADAPAAHPDDTTDVHGIADTSVLETTTGAQAKADAAEAAANAYTDTEVDALSGTLDAKSPYPRSAHLHIAQADQAYTATWAVQSNRWFGVSYTSSASQLERSIEWTTLLDAGTYTLTLWHAANSGVGIYRVERSTDGSSWTQVGSSVDGYAASLTPTRTDLTSISIPSSGRWYLRVRNPGGAGDKNASSSGWQMDVQALTARRTGA